MTTVTAAARRPQVHPVVLRRVVRSEWTKLISLRSTWIALLLALVLSLGIGALIASSLSDPSQPPPGGGPGAAGLDDPVASVLAGTSLAALVFGVLGALSASGEYATGAVSSTMTAVPRRWPVLVSKTMVLVALVAPVSLALSAGALWLGSLVLGDAADVSLTDPETLSALAGSTGYLTAMAVMGLGLGVLLRSQALSIAVLVAVVFVLPVLLPALSWEWVQTVGEHLPGSAGQGLQATTEAALSDPAAAWTLLAWTTIPLLAGAGVLQRRDV